MKLTNEQIKQNGLAMIAFSEGKRIQEYNTSNKGSRWYDVSDVNFYVSGYIWRPKPQPVSRPWSKPEDVPLNCWIRTGKGGPDRMVITVASDGIRIAGIYCDSAFYRWHELSITEYSTDRKTWKPCTVEKQP